MKAYNRQLDSVVIARNQGKSDFKRSKSTDNLKLTMPWPTSTIVLLLLLSLPQLAYSIGECKDKSTKKCQDTVVCPSCIKMGWSGSLARPPYLVQKNNQTSGLLFQIFWAMVLKCCGLTFGSQCGEFTHIMDTGLSDQGEYDVKLPLVVNFKESGLRSQRNVVPMLPHTGVAFVVRRDRVENDYSLQLLTAVFGAWPVLVLTLLLSVLAGVIAWALETKNPNEFPRSFVIGACEGFWWAFVSMTTVGYGDRAPKSLQGRAFAVIWILIGICIISIFTATLTTSLTTVSLENKISLPGSKVASLLYSIEATTGFQQQADVRRYRSFEDVMQAMEKNEVDGALLDSYVISYYKDRLPDSKYKVQEVIRQDSLEYGAFVNDSDLAACLKQVRYAEESVIYEIVEFSLSKSLASGIKEGSQSAQSIFDPGSDLFKRTLYVCGGVVGLFLILGVAYEIIRYRRNRGGDRDKMNNINSLRPPLIQESRDAMLDEVEKRLADELHKAIEAWKVKIKDGNHYLQTDEMMSSV